MTDAVGSVKDALEAVVSELKSQAGYLSSIEGALIKLQHDKMTLIKKLDQLQGAKTAYQTLLEKLGDTPSKEPSDASL